MSLRVGFVGLGSQGGPMARRIVDAGFPLTLWARRADSLDPFCDTAATYAKDIPELAASSDLLCVCVVDDAGVQQVVEAALPALPAGAILAIHSTIHPETCKAIARNAAERGLAVLDAPVSGGGPAAEAGTLTVMTGGDPAVLARVKPVFDCYAGAIFHLGPVGAGQIAKLVNNALLAANMALGDAALAAGRSLSVDPAALAELVKVSSGRSFGFEIRSRMPDPTVWTHGAALLNKDVGLLGKLLPDDPGYGRLADAAKPFLDPILQGNTP